MIDREVKKVMENKTISRFYFESIKATLERTIARLWVLVIMLIIFLVATNGAWLIYSLRT